MNAERVEPDRLEHVVAMEPLEPAVDVRAGEREHVPHVQPLGGGIGEHHELVERPPWLVQVGLVGVLLGPACLPGGLDDLRIVGGEARHTCLKLHRLAPPRNPAYLAPRFHGLDPEGPATTLHVLGGRDRARRRPRRGVARRSGSHADARASRRSAWGRSGGSGYRAGRELRARATWGSRPARRQSVPPARGGRSRHFSRPAPPRPDASPRPPTDVRAYTPARPRPRPCPGSAQPPPTD